MSKITIGLEIGSKAIKAVELLHKKGNYELKKLVRVEIPYEKKKEVATLEALRTLIRDHRINTRRIVLGVGGESVIVRRVNLPLMRKRELKQAIRWEAERYIPYPIDEICLDFHILEETSFRKKKEMAVVLVGVKKEVVENHLGLLQKADIIPQIIDANALALYNVFDLSYREGMKRAAILEIGHQVTTLVLMDEGNLFLVRNINIGGALFTQNIAEELKVEYPEAERIKEKYGFLVSSERAESEEEIKVKEEIDKIMRKSVNSLVEEIIRSFDYYASQTKGAVIEKVILSGGSSYLPDIDKFLAEELGIPVMKGNPFEHIIYKKEEFSSIFLARLGPIFSIGAGLALREISSL